MAYPKLEKVRESSLMKMLSPLLLGAMVCLLIAMVHAVPAEQKPLGQSLGSLTNTILTPQKFAEQAAWMGLKEIEVGALALKRSQSVEVRDLASQMLRDHSVAHRQLTRIAEQHHLILPPTNAFSGDRLDQIHLRNRGDAAVRERAAE